jgi:hypothetical protein
MILDWIRVAEEREGPRLSIELVPRTCWYSNVRSNVSAADWEKCKQFVRKRSGDRCEVCGGKGPKWPVECHEIWDYDDDESRQTLMGLIALCPDCHEVKHIGRVSVTEGPPGIVRCLEHLGRVNGWDLETCEAYVKNEFHIHALRSLSEWELDVSWLSFLGIETGDLDRSR